MNISPRIAHVDDLRRAATSDDRVAIALVAVVEVVLHHAVRR